MNKAYYTRWPGYSSTIVHVNFMSTRQPDNPSFSNVEKPIFYFLIRRLSRQIKKKKKKKKETKGFSTSATA